jgi:hypothetical protein
MDNLNKIRHQARRHFRNKRRESLKDQINKLVRSSKYKNIRYVYGGTDDLKWPTKLEAA